MCSTIGSKHNLPRPIRSSEAKSIKDHIFNMMAIGCFQNGKGFLFEFFSIDLPSRAQVVAEYFVSDSRLGFVGVAGRTAALN